MEASFFLSGDGGAYSVFDLHLRELGLSELWPALLVITALLAHAAYTDTGSYLPVLVIIGLVGFVSTAIIARYIEGRGR